MSYLLEVQTAAEKDLAEATYWYESHLEGLGLELLICFRASTQQIQQHPLGYEVKYKIKGRAVRVAMLNRFPYGVYFFVDENTIQIVAVMHAKRSDRNWKKRM
ncbi:MAG: hypothetical protein RIQ33_1846 [Bacteroidota bacterium]|jgi:plasmid stabilization system protein ParE